MASCVILNSVDHTLDKFPPEILTRIFRELQGNNLIQLTLVCKSFNNAISTSKELMGKISLRIPKTKELRDFAEIVDNSDRLYESLCNIRSFVDFDDAHLEFFKKHNRWKSLELSICSFSTMDSQVSFLETLAPHLEELDFNSVCIERNVRSGPVPVVNFPKLLKLKYNHIAAADLTCTTLKSLDVSKSDPNVIEQLLKSNHRLEELTMYFCVIESLFTRNLRELGIDLRLKKLTVQFDPSNSERSIKAANKSNFLNFLETQKDCIEEVMIEWDLNPLPKRYILQRTISGQFGRVPETIVRFDDITMRTLEVIFQHFTAIRKLTVAEKMGSNIANLSPVDAFVIYPNRNITDLRLRFQNAPMLDKISEKFIIACPNVKKLSVVDMNQHLLECCSRELLHIESIYSFSLTLEALPSNMIRFSKLQRISFCMCIVKNHPELRGMELSAQKAAVLGMIVDRK